MSRSRLAQLQTAALAIAITYNGIVTQDVKLLRVPLKTYLLAACLVLWALQRRPWRARDRLPRLTAPVLAIGIGVPVIWLAVAVIGRHTGSAEQRRGLTYGVTEASHFLYLLIFFPLLDHARAVRDAAERIWTVPALATCAFTLVVWLLWVLFGFNYGNHELNLLSGVIGPGAGPFRVELVTQVLFIPVLAVLLARVSADGMSQRSAALIAFVLAATVISHTRGYWLGLLTVSGVLIVLAIARPRYRRLRLAVIAAILVGLAASQVAPLIGPSASSVSEISLSTRIVEAHQLIHGVRADPILGSGLGATLADGYTRSTSNPWSFELTYLQLLFELGIVGLIVVVALPLWVLWSLLRVLDALSGNARRHAHAAIAGMLALLVADATNPYLINSVGMLTLAVVCVSAELALTAERPREHARATALSTATSTNLASTPP